MQNQNFSFFFFSLRFEVYSIVIYLLQVDVLFVHPTPENSDTIYYNKMNNACYKYNKTQVQCTKMQKKNIIL